MRDNRQWVSDTTAHPYSAVVQVSVTFSDGTSGMGSGVMIGRNDVLTAGHNLWDEWGGYATKVEVTPAKNGPYEPFGSFAAKSWTVSDSYRAYDSFDDDYGVINLAQNIGDETGYLNYSAAYEYNIVGQNVTITGYPGDRSDGERMYTADGSVAFYDSWDTIGYTDIYTAPGMSGSPIYLTSGADENTVVGVHTYSAFYGFYNGGTLLTDEAVADIAEWAADTVTDDPVTSQTTDIMGSAFQDFIGPVGSFDSWYWRDQSDDILFTDNAVVIWAGAGDDHIYVNGAEIAYGNPGKDFIIDRNPLNGIADILYGGQGEDSIQPGANDIAYGNKGADIFFGGPGVEIYYGGQSNDDIRSGPGDDIIYGNKGDDRFSNGDHGYLSFGGHDTVYGGVGVDTLSGYNHTPENGFNTADFLFQRNTDGSITVSYAEDAVDSSTLYGVEWIEIGTALISTDWI